MEGPELGIGGVGIRVQAVAGGHLKDMVAMFDLARTSSDPSTELSEGANSVVDNPAWARNAKVAKEVGVVGQSHRGALAG